MARVKAVQPFNLPSGHIAVGQEMDMPAREARALEQMELVHRVPLPAFQQGEWNNAPGRELRQPKAVPYRINRVVACVNIWNDLPALKQTAPLWLAAVDDIIVIDGRYGSVERSTDGLPAWCAARGATLLEPPADGWRDQNAKRSEFFQHTGDGDLLFIVDADEFITNPSALRAPCTGDVGWVTLASDLYQRPYGQPRLIRWQEGLQYRGRHHWIYKGEDLLCTHQYAGPGVANYLVPLGLRNERGLGRDDARVTMGLHIRTQQYAREQMKTTGAKESDQVSTGRESLRVLQVGSYDPGLVMFRLHTAINTTSPHASALVIANHDNPYEGPTQMVLSVEEESLEDLRPWAESADVIHCHLDYSILNAMEELGWRLPPVVVMHHHGTVLRNAHEWFQVVDQQRAALTLISNFDLQQFAPWARWLPNPVPVGHYQRIRQAALASRKPGKDLIIGHSPSKRHLKGTDDFLHAVTTLRAKGVPVDARLIEFTSHAEAVRAKAECDLFFDSFWLGIQCSGLEAGAMGIPVIAGDPYVREQYITQLGTCPYVYADNAKELSAQIEMLAMDGYGIRAFWGDKTYQYVRQYHDDAAVTLRYLDMLDAATGWRQQLAIPVETDRADYPWVEWPVGEHVQRPAMPGMR